MAKDLIISIAFLVARTGPHEATQLDLAVPTCAWHRDTVHVVPGAQTSFFTIPPVPSFCESPVNSPVFLVATPPVPHLPACLPDMPAEIQHYALLLPSCPAVSSSIQAVCKVKVEVK